MEVARRNSSYRPLGPHAQRLSERARPVIFNQLVLSGNLWTYLADINEHAQQRMEVLIKQMMISEGVTEESKETNQIEWVQRINNIQHHIEIILLNELIHI